MNIHAQNSPKIETGVSQELAIWRAANYSDVRYRLNLTLEKMSPTLKGSIEISLENKADQIILDWRKIVGKEQFTTVSNVRVNDKTAKFDERDEHLIFRENVKTGANVIKIDFTSPIATSGAGVTRYVDKEDNAEYIYSLFVPSDASTTFPCFDQPDLKAKFSLILTIPEEWKADSNSPSFRFTQLVGLRTNIKIIESTPKQQTIRFQETQPISTYVFAFAAGDFQEFNDGDNPKSEVQNPKSSVFVRKSQAEKFKQHATEVFRLNREAVKYL
ncbi:MAG: hypothetical protein H7Z37_15125, partial [Pyrinomonadaceae bacterium]|nr:hypothetical protein [Pyrinomonadaceae bacterium]